MTADDLNTGDIVYSPHYEKRRKKRREVVSVKPVRILEVCYGQGTVQATIGRGPRKTCKPAVIAKWVRNNPLADAERREKAEKSSC